MTSLKSIATALAVTAGLVASNVMMFAASAKADGYRAYGHHRPVAPRYVEPPRVYLPPQRQHHGRDHRGDAIGAAILGLGALVVGAAIADAARREHNERRYERDED